jgi:hypothetical protein
MLAACAAGLATCWVGLSQGWLATAEGKAALGLPAACLPIAPIIVGRPKSSPARPCVPDIYGSRRGTEHHEPRASAAPATCVASVISRAR